MNDDEYTAEEWSWIRARDDELRPFLRTGQYAEAIFRVQAWLRQEGRPRVRSSHLRLLQTLFGAAGEPGKAVEAAEQAVQERPEDPLTWCALAMAHRDPALGVDALQHALHAIETAIGKARATGAYLRYCLNDRARIAVAMSRWDLLEQTLRETLEIPPRRGVVDIRLEDDFLRTIPEGVVDHELLRRYREACAAREARRTGRGSAGS